MPLPIVAIEVLLLLHPTVPPETSDRPVVAPTQTADAPVISAGVALIVTVWLRVQPVGSVYMMFAEPELTPVTTPEASTVALDVLLLLHVPPVSEGVSMMELPVHITAIPDDMVRSGS